jgi:hypothetical protein
MLYYVPYIFRDDSVRRQLLITNMASIISFINTTTTVTTSTLNIAAPVTNALLQRSVLS